MERTFDRRPSFDERSRNFHIRAIVAPTKTPVSYTWSCPVRLDQGDDGACVGFAIAQEHAAKPFPHTDVTNAFATHIYYIARTLDEWPGEDYDGTSVLAGMKTAVQLGLYTEYRWAFSVDDLKLMRYTGPFVLGLNWREGMMKPDSKGYLHPTGPVVGGHAILCNSYSKTYDDFGLVNSWGAGWGKGGTARIRSADLATLLADEGEAVVPLVRT